MFREILLRNKGLNARKSADGGTAYPPPSRGQALRCFNEAGKYFLRNPSGAAKSLADGFTALDGKIHYRLRPDNWSKNK
jgi:hypothetical protein